MCLPHFLTELPLVFQVTGGHLAPPVEPHAAGREEQRRGADHLRRTHVQKPLHAHPADERQPQ